MTWMHDQRLEAVLGALRSVGAATIVDLGCGDGPLLVRLAHEVSIRRIVGVDVSAEALEAMRKHIFNWILWPDFSAIYSPTSLSLPRLG